MGQLHIPRLVVFFTSILCVIQASDGGSLSTQLAEVSRQFESFQVEMRDSLLQLRQTVDTLDATKTLQLSTGHLQDNATGAFYPQDNYTLQVQTNDTGVDVLYSQDNDSGALFLQDKEISKGDFSKKLSSVEERLDRCMLSSRRAFMDEKLYRKAEFARMAKQADDLELFFRNTTASLKEQIKRVSNKLSIAQNTLNSSLKELETRVEHLQLSVANDMQGLGEQLDSVSRDLGDHGTQLAALSARLMNTELEQQQLSLYETNQQMMLEDIRILNEWKVQIDPFLQSMMRQNLALLKPTRESSHYDSEFNKGSDAAVDGRRDNNWSMASCTHSKMENNPWWMVDLGYEALVGLVLIQNRGDCCGQRLRNIAVTLHSQMDSEGRECARFSGPGQNGQLVTLKCTAPVTGRFLKVQINGNEFLTLCEVEVYSL